MSSVSFTGLATGMDTATLVEQLVELRRAPIYRLQSQRTSFEAQKSALSTLQEKLQALQTAAQNLDSINEFASLAATSADEDLLTVTANTDASPGEYEIAVSALAQAQKSRTQGYDSRLASVGQGDLVFTIGGTQHTLELTGPTTLADLADRINEDLDGISATIINTGAETGGYHLMLTGEPGSDNTFTVNASGLSGGTAPTMTSMQAATDAQLTVDGLAVTASGNQLTDVIAGLTLDLHDVTAAGAPVRVSVATDPAGVQEQVQAFVDAYNEVFAFLETGMGTGGKLEGNASARSIANRLENVMTASHSGEGAYSILAQVGVSRQQGSRQLAFDAAEFATALAEDYQSVRNLFVEFEGNVGKASLIGTAVDDLTDSVGGIFKIGTDSLERRIDNIDHNIERYERSIESYRSTLQAKFLAMESTVSLLQAQGSYLSSFGVG
jgi:flagellar hook-associated protein 2